MKKSLEVYKQIAETLAKHFDGLYYVDLESGAYTELVAIKILKDLAIASDGKDFFKESSASAKKCVLLYAPTYVPPMGRFSDYNPQYLKNIAQGRAKEKLK